MKNKTSAIPSRLPNGKANPEYAKQYHATKKTQRDLDRKQSIEVMPRWFTYEQASIYSGLGTRVLENHVRAGFIISSNACAPGCTRGRRLISRESLDAFIEAGVGKAPTSLAMNANRKVRAKK